MGEHSSSPGQEVAWPVALHRAVPRRRHGQTRVSESIGSTGGQGDVGCFVGYLQMREEGEEMLQRMGNVFRRRILVRGQWETDSQEKV